MIPIALDPRFARLAVAGNGPLALRRYRALRDAGADDALIFADSPQAGLEEAFRDTAGNRLRPRLPDAEDFAGVHAVWIVDLDDDRAVPLAKAARAAGTLVNVEDRLPFCDFHSVAELRRGDLLITVSTGGRAAGLAGVIRENLEACFGEEWADRVAEIAERRAGWRRARMTMSEVHQRIKEHVRIKGWL